VPGGEKEVVGGEADPEGVLRMIGDHEEQGGKIVCKEVEATRKLGG
jgi:hypothetical protein